MQWTLPPPDPAADARAGVLAANLGLPPTVTGLLVRRGHGDAETAQEFLSPRLKRLGDPFELPDMEAAVERLLLAADRGESVALFGDYDVDGVTSLAILAEVLGHLGVRAACFLPSRMDEGYGLSAEGIARCLEEHRPSLMVAVDCGTSAAREALLLAAQGVDLIVLDHHELGGGERPVCAALVNPKLDPAGRHANLCSAGVVFKVGHALLKRRPAPACDLRTMLDLAALGTVADIVSLIGENRILVRHGLARLARTARPGLRALCELTGLASGEIRASDVGWRLGPRLNAAGRLGTAQAALELLRTDDPARAAELANGLHAQNAERQAVEKRVLAEAQRQLADDHPPLEGNAAIVVGARGWHPGVVGIVASRLARAHHRPAWVIGFDEQGLGKGSGRSIEGLSLVETLGECASHIVKGGGHEMAAGVTLREENFAAFRSAFLAAARARLSDEQLQPRLRLDAEIALDALDEDFYAHYEAMQPFGQGNREPLFLARRVAPCGPPRVMKEKHLRMFLRPAIRGQGEVAPACAVWFSPPSLDLPPPPWDVAFRLSADEWQGERRWQLMLEGLRAAED